MNTFRILGLILVVAIIFHSCHNEEFTPVKNNVVQQVTLNGVVVQDTVKFGYSDGTITSANWCTHIAGENTCAAGFSETRYYDNSGVLDSISGRWNVSIEKESGRRKKITAFKDGSYYSTITFVEYAGSNPSKVMVEFPDTDPSFIELTFDADGNLTHKTSRDLWGRIFEETAIEYSTVANPMRQLLETPSFAVSFFGFDEFVFYYSKNVPVTVTSSTTLPVVPQHSVIHYDYTLDAAGRLVSAGATRDQYLQHAVQIRYRD